MKMAAKKSIQAKTKAQRELSQAMTMLEITRDALNTISRSLSTVAKGALK